MKSIATGNVVLCEFVATGGNNKHVLVNTFSGDIIVNELPARLSFGLYLEIIPDVDLGRGVIDLDLMLGKSKVASIKADILSAKKAQPALIILNQFQLGTDVETLFRVVLKQEGYRTTTALTKNILRGPIVSPNASTPQP
jgi:hypothetical protein